MTQVCIVFDPCNHTNSPITHTSLSRPLPYHSGGLTKRAGLQVWRDNKNPMGNWRMSNDLIGIPSSIMNRSKNNDWYKVLKSFWRTYRDSKHAPKLPNAKRTNQSVLMATPPPPWVPLLILGLPWDEAHEPHMPWSKYWQLTITSWWFQPIWKILVKMGIFPK